MSARSFTPATPRTVVSVLIAAALVSLAGCGDDKSAAPSTKAARATPNQTAASSNPGTSAVAATPAGAGGTDPAEGARAEKTSDVMKWLQLLPDKAAKPEPKPVAAATPAPTPAPAPAPAPVAVAKAPPAPAPVVEAPAPAPVQVAMAAPPTPAAVTPVPVVLKLISRIEPSYPKEALRQDIRQGHVKVRISVDKDGTVSGATVVEASPRNVFDRSVLAAVHGWKYAPISEPSSTMVEFDFNLD